MQKAMMFNKFYSRLILEAQNVRTRRGFSGSTLPIQTSMVENWFCVTKWRQIKKKCNTEILKLPRGISGGKLQNIRMGFSNRLIVYCAYYYSFVLLSSSHFHNYCWSCKWQQDLFLELFHVKKRIYVFNFL